MSRSSRACARPSLSGLPRTQITTVLAGALVALIALSGCGDESEAPETPGPPRWTLTQADVGGGTTREGLTRSWAEDSCATMARVDTLVSDAGGFSGGAYEIRWYNDTVDNPFSVVVQVEGNPRYPGREYLDRNLKDMWEMGQACAKMEPREGFAPRISFEAFGPQPVPGTTTQPFGWTSVLQGPFFQTESPWAPIYNVPDPSFGRDSAEKWYATLWITEVDGCIIAVGTQGAQPPVLDARKLLDVVAQRVKDDPPNPVWSKKDK